MVQFEIEQLNCVSRPERPFLGSWRWGDGAISCIYVYSPENRSKPGRLNCTAQHVALSSNHISHMGAMIQMIVVLRGMTPKIEIWQSTSTSKKDRHSYWQLSKGLFAGTIHQATKLSTSASNTWKAAFRYMPVETCHLNDNIKKSTCCLRRMRKCVETHH
jgi:hypothetical protein